MAALNQCNFIGNLGRDIEIRHTQNGTAVGSTSMAVTEKYKDQEKTEWVRLVFWGKQAEIAEQYTSKGSQLFISGRMQTRQWEKDGVTQYTTEIHVREFQFLGGNKQQGGGNQGYQHEPDKFSPRPKIQENYRQPNPEPIPDDDIPF